MKFKVLMLFMLLGLTACQDSKETVLEAIKVAEGNLYGNQGDNFEWDPAKAQDVLTAYNRFTGSYTTDPATPEYLFKTAEIYKSLKEYPKAVDCYKRIIDNYADYEKASTSLFLLGFSYENDLKNYAKAKDVYQQFLEKYPTHELADDVEFSLKNLGRPVDEIIKEMQEKIQAQQQTGA